MPSKELIALALQFKKEKLWKKIFDSEIFALTLSNGQIGYCSISGRYGTHFSLTLYYKGDSLDNLRCFAKPQSKSREGNALEKLERMSLRDCLQISLENKSELSDVELIPLYTYAQENGIEFRGRSAFPKFWHFIPRQNPTHILTQEETDFLCQALRASLAVSKQLETFKPTQCGFSQNYEPNTRIPFLQLETNGHYIWGTLELPPTQPINLPSPTLSDELLAARIKRKKITSDVIAVELNIFPTLVYDDDAPDDDVPIYPYFLVVYNTTTDEILPTPFARFLENNEELIDGLAQFFLENRKPRLIIVRDQRTRIYLENFAKQLKIPLEKRDQIPIMDIVIDYITQGFNNYDVDEADKEMDTSTLPMDEFFDLDEITMARLPQYLWEKLVAMDDMALLPQELSYRIQKISKIRSHRVD